MDVHLQPQHAKRIREQIARGEFASAEEAVASALDRAASTSLPSRQDRIRMLEEFEDWMEEQPAVPTLPDEALSREALYGRD